MSDILTRLTLPGKPGWGLMDYGRLSVAEMVAQYRSHIDHLRAQVAAADATPDAGFAIDVVRGVHRQKLIEKVQAAEQVQTPA